MSKELLSTAFHEAGHAASAFELRTLAGRPVCRLGLASRGNNTNLEREDILLALDQGVNFRSWCGTPNAMSRTITELGPRRAEVFVCVQFEARTAEDADRELANCPGTELPRRGSML